MTNIQAWNWLVAFAVPFIVGFINRPSWSAQTKRWMMLAVSIVIGVVGLIIQGAFTPFDLRNVLQYLILVVGAVQVAYQLLKQVPVTNKLLDKAEVAGSGQTPADAVLAASEVKAEAVQEYQRNVQPAAPL